ncbi:unnamed protein product [Vitrella brassicaformis CCMP3155]|uniref:AD domain-containing protein n=1 Tax=Vitrella brassicaformis (strain CCMP3155) TaxID=1169540 RepID=A0A0G4EI09_VITBC|nr:unnamed protein product [Vitrella brassicaformis CCMP3155]|eukprot:CEL95600.1 unnamed protein product [Vitrella brassicaformis CCMP3155]
MSVCPQFLGAPIVVKLTTGDKYMGELFCYDISAECVILREEGADGATNYRVINFNVIGDVSAAGAPKKEIDPHLPAIPDEWLEHRRREAKEKAAKERRTWGVGVSKDAQDLFDFLHKTAPEHELRWDKQDIICFGVRVRPPYLPDKCSGGDPKAQERIKKILANFHAKRQKRAREQAEKDREPAAVSANQSQSHVHTPSTQSSSPVHPSPLSYHPSPNSKAAHLPNGVSVPSKGSPADKARVSPQVTPKQNEASEANDMVMAG